MSHMASDLDAFGGRRPPGFPGRALAAALALAVIGGLGLWGWKLGTRDVGEVPVVRALLGPMKKRPDDAGGLKMGDSDLAVTRLVSGETDSGIVTVLPDAEYPAEEDRPIPDLAERIGPPPAPATRPDDAPAPGPGPRSGPNADSNPDATAAPESAAGAGAPFRLIPPAEGYDPPKAQVESGRPVDPPDATANAPKVTPVPRLRIARAAAGSPAAAAAAEPAPAAESVAPAAPATLAAGDVVIQLGAFNTPQVAEAQWRAKRRRNDDLLRDYVHAVTTVRSGGRDLFRLRVGPLKTRAAAQELCAALKARSEACIVARVRQ